MDKLITLIYGIPKWSLITGGGGIAAIIAVLIISIIYRKRNNIFSKYLEEVIENDNFSNDFYSPAFIKRHSGKVAAFADRTNSRIIKLTGLDAQWLEQLKEKPREKNVKKILKYIPEQGLFSCFIASLKRPAITKIILEYLGTEPGSLRQLPLSSSGEPFDGKAAKLMFNSRMDEIREMAGDPEWPVRYFSIKLLLNEDSDRSKRVILEAFSDPHPLVRKSVIEECIIGDRVKMYDLLKDHLLDDPCFEVRESAFNRITVDFKDIHRIDYSSLTAVQSLHSLEFLDPDIENDIDAALNFLEGDDLELRYPSAMFLQEIKTLGRMLKDVSFEDTKNLERTTKLLINAAEVNITGFLDAGIHSPAALFTALLLLKKTGARQYISGYALKVFENNYEYDEKIWKNAVDCIGERGNEDAVKILLKELIKVKYNDTQIKYILNNLPSNIEFLSFDILMDLLKDNNFNSREALIGTISTMSEDIILPELFRILKAGRAVYSHKVRITALQILAGYKLTYCLQPIIEQLPTLPVPEAKEFSAMLSNYAGETFDNRVLKLLEQPDGKVRAAVIASLPGTGKKEFLKPIKEALIDADPDVRIAGIWALADYKESKMLNQGFDMLRDPVARVRIGAAEALAIFGNQDKLNNFSDLLKDENEVIEVKKAAIIGLSKSDQNKAVDILVELIDENEELEEEAIKALALKPSKKAITRIIENIKDASPVLRDKIMNVFKLMGASGEDALKKLLAEDIASLKDSITGILETTGYVGHVIRKLSHRDPLIRRSAAEFLSMLGTESAFRGIVLAARDPDKDVRVQVIRALEKLNSKSGEKILQSLKSDPDKRVRKFTMWALARTKAKGIED